MFGFSSAALLDLDVSVISPGFSQQPGTCRDEEPVFQHGVCEIHRNPRRRVDASGEFSLRRCR